MKPLIFLLFIANSFIGIGQVDFKGKISWKIERGKETFYRDITVKNDSVKLEEWNKLSPKNKSIILFDLKVGKANILSNERKTYLVLQAENDQIDKIEFNFSTEETVDSLLNLSVVKWKVDAYNLDRISNYWFSATNFVFYRKMLVLLPEQNFLEKQFLQLPVSEEVLPLKAEYSNINNKQVTTMEVISIDLFVPTDATFKIPKGYRAF
jgi:hypothetical protein